MCDLCVCVWYVLSCKEYSGICKAFVVCSKHVCAVPHLTPPVLMWYEIVCTVIAAAKDHWGWYSDGARLCHAMLPNAFLTAPALLHCWAVRVHMHGVSQLFVLSLSMCCHLSPECL